MIKCLQKWESHQPAIKRMEAKSEKHTPISTITEICIETVKDKEQFCLKKTVKQPSILIMSGDGGGSSTSTTSTSSSSSSSSGSSSSCSIIFKVSMS